MARTLKAGSKLDRFILTKLELADQPLFPSSNTDDAMRCVEELHERFVPIVDFVVTGLGYQWGTIFRDREIYEVAGSDGRPSKVLNNTMSLGKTPALAVACAIAIRGNLAERHFFDGPAGTPYPREFEEQA